LNVIAYLFVKTQTYKPVDILSKLFTAEERLRRKDNEYSIAEGLLEEEFFKEEKEYL